MKQVLHKKPVQFGILRMLVALCPGFGAAVAAVIWMKFSHPYYPVMGQGLVVTVLTVAFGLAVVFGWLDAMFNPALPKTEGCIRIPVLLKSIAIFVLAQIIVAPVMFAGSLMMFGIAKMDI